MNEQVISINQIVSRVKHLEIRARKLVEDALQSDYHSVFKGRGIEFNEVRNYNPGDDVRDIDWNVTARMADPYVKTYIEERQLTVIFAVDISSSMFFGGSQSKRNTMAQITALLGFASFFNNDRAGLVLFSSDIEKVVPPMKEHSHLLRIIRDTWYSEPQFKGTDIAQSLRRIANLMKKKTIIFLLSDFLGTDYEKPLFALCRKHEVIPIVVRDSMEDSLNLNYRSSLPVLIDVEDIEWGTTQTIDLGSQKQTEIERYRKYYKKIFSKLNLDWVEVHDRMDYFKEIEMLLKRRARKR